MVRVTFACGAAPSWKAWRLAGRPLPKTAVGQRPSDLVVIATDAEGYRWQHERIFGSHEIERARQLIAAVEDRGEINPRHWRKTHKEY